MISRLDAIKNIRRNGSVDLTGHSFISAEVKWVGKRQRLVGDIFFNKEVESPYDDTNEPTSWVESKISAKDVLRIIRQHFDRFPVVFVNAYSVSRHFVHPAEGGIWDDFGEPLASVPVFRKGDAVEKMRAHLIDVFGPTYEGNRHRGSVLGGENLEVYVEAGMAQRFPDKPFEYS